MATEPDYILALDVGDKRIGVAIAHRVARLPRPLTTLLRNDSSLREIAQLVTAEAVRAVVVGLPRGMSGQHTAQTRSAEAFADALKRELTVPVYLSDETLTSVQAETELAKRPHGKGDIDALAATYILESFLLEHPEAVAS
jgi:putative Holliday junction resolvase